MEMLLTAPEVCVRLHISAATLARWIKIGRLVPGVRAGRRTLFRVTDLEAFESNNAKL